MNEYTTGMNQMRTNDAPNIKTHYFAYHYSLLLTFQQKAGCVLKGTRKREFAQLFAFQNH